MSKCKKVKNNTPLLSAESLFSAVVFETLSISVIVFIYHIIGCYYNIVEIHVNRDTFYGIIGTLILSIAIKLCLYIDKKLEICDRKIFHNIKKSEIKILSIWIPAMMMIFVGFCENYANIFASNLRISFGSLFLLIIFLFLAFINAGMTKNFSYILAGGARYISNCLGLFILFLFLRFIIVGIFVCILTNGDNFKEAAKSIMLFIIVPIFLVGLVVSIAFSLFYKNKQYELLRHINSIALIEDCAILYELDGNFVKIFSGHSEAFSNLEKSIVKQIGG